MRTTIDMPDQLFRRAKATASLRGVTLKQFASEAVERELDSNEIGQLARGRPVQLPLVPSKRPGSVAMTPVRVAELLEAEDLDALAGR